MYLSVKNGIISHNEAQKILVLKKYLSSSVLNILDVIRCKGCNVFENFIACWV